MRLGQISLIVGYYANVNSIANNTFPRTLNAYTVVCNNLHTRDEPTRLEIINCTASEVLLWCVCNKSFFSSLPTSKQYITCCIVKTGFPSLGKAKCDTLLVPGKTFLQKRNKINFQISVDTHFKACIIN